MGVNIDDNKTLAHAVSGRMEASLERTRYAVELLPHVRIEFDWFAWHLCSGWLMWMVTITWWRSDGH